MTQADQRNRTSAMPLGGRPRSTAIAAGRAATLDRYCRRSVRPVRVLRLDLNGVMTPMVRTAINWVFRDRATGKLVIAQRPNVPLTLWLACIVAGWLVHPQGRWSTVLGAVGAIALVIWAGDEVVRGVNPGRRIL